MNKYLSEIAREIKKEYLGKKETLVGLDSIIKWYAEEWDDGFMWGNPILDEEYIENFLERGEFWGIQHCNDDCIVISFNIIETNVDEDGEYCLTVIEIKDVKVMNSKKFIFS